MHTFITTCISIYMDKLHHPHHSHEVRVFASGLILYVIHLTKPIVR